MDSTATLWFLQAIVLGGFSAFIAKEKNRDLVSWFFLGFLFSLIALIALIAIPKLEQKPNLFIAEKLKPDWYYKPIKRISKQQRILRLSLIFLGIVIFLALVKALN